MRVDHEFLLLEVMSKERKSVGRKESTQARVVFPFGRSRAHLVGFVVDAVHS